MLQGAWVGAGTHVKRLGSHSLTTREADTELIRRAAVYTALMASPHNEGGDVMIPVAEGAIDAGHAVGEIGRVVSGELPARLGVQVDR
jgi:ornithine cyclodeaminase